MRNTNQLISKRVRKVCNNKIHVHIQESMTLCSSRVAPEPDASLMNTDCCTLSPKFQVHQAWEAHIQKDQLSNVVTEHRFL